MVSMKKPQLYLAVSVSIALMQANMLPALSDPATQAIWQKLAGATTSAKAAPAASRAKLAAAPVRHAVAVSGKRSVPPSALSVSAQGLAARGSGGQVMLFFKSNDNNGSAQAHAPAAALTIHPALPENSSVSETAVEPAKQSPTLVAMSEIPPGSLRSEPQVEAVSPVNAAEKQLVAQLMPDQIVAQGEQSGGTTSTPIPPVVSGAVDLEEFKPSNVLDLKVSQSRTFKLKNKILRTSISDPSIAEPIVVAENQIVLLGKAPGGTTLVLWDDAGNSVAVDVKVSRDYAQLQASIREIDPRIIVEPFSVGGADRVILLGDVDHPESVIRAFTAANMFMDDRGMKITVANGRLVDARVGEQGVGGGSSTGGQTGVLSALSSVDKYTYFSNNNNNISTAQTIISDGGRVTSLVRIRKVPLIVLHVTFLEMNTAAARELGTQLGLNFTSQSFAFGLGGNNLNGAAAGPILLSSLPGTNGTQGSAPFPFAAGSINPIVPFAPGTPTTSATQTTLNELGFPINSVTTFQPAQQNIIGFLQQGMQKSAQYGATSAPVSFTAANIIPQLLGNQVINTNISAIGQGAFVTPPTLLGQSSLLGSPGGASFTTSGLANVYQSTSNFNSGSSSRWSVNPTLQGIISHSRARVLAEPTLVTISGERAAFLAGGEIPVPQSAPQQGASAQTVAFEPFGLKLNMIPVLMENGNINIEVAPEERILSLTNQLLFVGSSTPIPGFTTRKTQTIVEMKPGQELFISGLVSANSGRELTKTPLIGEVPVLGALYRSKAFNKNESELIVAIRPEIILPGNPGQMKLPEEISKVEGPRDTNMLQVEPTVVDERYMTSGRAEHSQKIPGILPPGAPVPDNQ
jgi:Flp pilus assembly secretin CpaC